MIKLNFKDAIEIWKSWTFLCAILFFFSIMWFFPSEWITDTDLAALYAKYRPGFGLLAIVFGLVFGTKVIIEIFKHAVLWNRRISEKRKQEKQTQKNQDSKFRGIQWTLSSEERELLNTCVEKGDPEIIVHAGDHRTEMLFAAGLLFGAENIIGNPKHKFYIQPWLWDRLRKNPDYLRGVKRP